MRDTCLVIVSLHMYRTEIQWKEGKDPTEGSEEGMLGDGESSFFLFFSPPDIEEGTKPSMEVMHLHPFVLLK